MTRAGQQVDQVNTGTELGEALNAYGQTVMRIDPATGQVTGTFLIPDRSANWRGIAATGSQLFVLGDTGSEGAVLSLQMP